VKREVAARLGRRVARDPLLRAVRACSLETGVPVRLVGGLVRDARVALGGVATVPWRAREVEILLKDQKFDDTLARRVAEAAFAAATPRKHNAFKIKLGQRVVARALHQAATMEV